MGKIILSRRKHGIFVLRIMTLGRLIQNDTTQYNTSIMILFRIAIGRMTLSRKFKNHFVKLEWCKE
jgi:hypothetical protein